ncbi:MAG: general secretion pathway protein GspB [Pirellulales bacterium]|nr:general secretion pathway protein GspB [Pirellulales bacterium]
MSDIPSSAITEKLKIAIIPVLATLLLVMLYHAFSGANESQTDTPSVSSTTTRQVPQATLAKLPPRTSQNPLRHWPQQTLAEILKYDPFSITPQQPGEQNQPPTTGGEKAALAGQMKQPHSATDSRFTNKIPEMMFHSRHGTMAVIDSQVVREGEILRNGTRVVEIRTDGIVLERPDAG